MSGGRNRAVLEAGTLAHRPAGGGGKRQAKSMKSRKQMFMRLSYDLPNTYLRQYDLDQVPGFFLNLRPGVNIKSRLFLSGPPPVSGLFSGYFSRVAPLR